MQAFFRDHTLKDLITPYEQTRAGFIVLALEKNRRATTFIEEARALKAIACKEPIELLGFDEIRSSILTASGVSDKASNYLTEDNKNEAIKSLIEGFLEPAGKDFIDELVYRFLLRFVRRKNEKSGRGFGRAQIQPGINIYCRRQELLLATFKIQEMDQSDF